MKFNSALVSPPYVRRSRRVSAALPWPLKGVSKGDMREALEVLLGEDTRGLSPNVVSRLKAQWADEYLAWARHDPSRGRYAYRWADGMHTSLRGESVDHQRLLTIVGVRADPCVEAPEEAILKRDVPAIINTDQGSQFTSSEFIGVLHHYEIQISMDGRGCWRDNVFVERLWKSVKHEEIYMHGYDTASEVKQALNRYFDFYNRRRPHSSLDGQTPDTVYFNPSPLLAAA